MFIYNLQEKAKSLQSEYDNLSSRIEHSGLKGTIREDVLKKYLKELLPKKYEVTSGCIVDCSEKQSKQQDFIIFDNFNSPSFVESEKEQIVPIESVYATVEIKSNLTIEELKKAIINIDSVHELEKTKSTVPQLFSSPTRAPLSMIFSYTSDTSLENIAKKLDELNERFTASVSKALNEKLKENPDKVLGDKNGSKMPQFDFHFQSVKPTGGK